MKLNLRTFCLAALLALLLCINAIGSDTNQTLKVNTTLGTWMKLPTFNNFAEIGPSNNDISINSPTNTLINRVTVSEFEKEITVTASPLTENIRATGQDAFEVPIGEVASWRVHIEVTNTNLLAVENAVVTDNFSSELSVLVDQKSIGFVELKNAGNTQTTNMTWAIGYLPVGGSAYLDLIVTTKQNLNGIQEYALPGDYRLNSSATLNYTLQSIPCNTNSNVILIRTVLPKSQMLTTMQSEQALESMSSGVSFTEEFQPLSTAITDVILGFMVPEDLRLEWRLVMTVKNNSDRDITDVKVTEELGDELDYDLNSVDVIPKKSGSKPPREPYSTLNIVKSSNVKITWEVSQLKRGGTAQLTMTIYTRIKNGKQMYSDPTPIWQPEYLNLGAVLKYLSCGTQASICKPKIPVWVKDGEFLRVSLSATRYDWRIRKPGIFAADPIVADVSSNHQIAVKFSGFADLAAISGGGSIPTYYGFGDTIAAVNENRWREANKLNAYSLQMPESKIGKIWSWKLWPKLQVNSSTRAAEYEDSGTITYTVVQCQPFVEGLVAW